MEFFRIRRDIPFMRHALVFNIISFATFLAAVFFLATRGLHFSIEFTGGTLIEASYAQTADIPKIRKVVEGLDLGEVQVQNFGSSRDVLIRLPVRGNVKQADLVAHVFAELCKAEGGVIATKAAAVDKGETSSRQVCSTAGAGAGTAFAAPLGDASVAAASAVSPVALNSTSNPSNPATTATTSPLTAAAANANEPLRLQRNEVVGPQVGRELAENGAWALGFVVVGIMIYLAFRFEWKFSVAAIVANLHDVVIILGFFAFFQWEFSLAVLAGVLAVLGYSVNESVVIFDRIRESFRRFRKLDTEQVIDHAITSTISRTIITHGCTQMMVLSMLIFGGQTLHYFAVALTIGILFGIYSSVFVAAAIAMWLGVKRDDLVKTGRKETDPDDPNAGAVV